MNPLPPHVHTVLVVEDDSGTREAMQTLLETEGYAVICARNAEHGARVVRNEPRPCIIVLDLMMSGTSGQDFRRAQLADAAVRDIPVILVSGIRDLSHQAEDLKVATYLPKPLDVPRLLEAIDRHCNRATAVA